MTDVTYAGYSLKEISSLLRTHIYLDDSCGSFFGNLEYNAHRRELWKRDEQKYRYLETSDLRPVLWLGDYALDPSPEKTAQWFRNSDEVPDHSLLRRIFNRISGADLRYAGDPFRCVPLSWFSEKAREKLGFHPPPERSEHMDISLFISACALNDEEMVKFILDREKTAKHYYWSIYESVPLGNLIEGASIAAYNGHEKILDILIDTAESLPAPDEKEERKRSPKERILGAALVSASRAGRHDLALKMVNALESVPVELMGIHFDKPYSDGIIKFYRTSDEVAGKGNSATILAALEKLDLRPYDDWGPKAPSLDTIKNEIYKNAREYNTPETVRALEDSGVFDAIIKPGGLKYNRPAPAQSLTPG